MDKTGMVDETPQRSVGCENAVERKYFAIPELAHRRRRSEGTLYKRKRATGATVLDLASRNKRSKKVVPAHTALKSNGKQQREVPDEDATRS